VRWVGSLFTRHPLVASDVSFRRRGQVFSRAIQEIAPHLVREQGFISDFLNITSVDTSITFADYMMLETFFRRSASAHLAQQAQQGKLRDIKTAMELVFGFLEGELKSWIDDVLQKDPM
jgi:hypothetical protein